MNADSDQSPVAASVVKALRAVGKQVRKLRGDSLTFFSECTDLELDAWSPDRFPGVVYGQNASDLVFDVLQSGRPAMVCRLGSTELATMSSATRSLSFTNAWELVSGSALVRDIGIHAGLVRSLCTLSGFFPASVERCREFVDLMLADIPLVDVLGTWCKQEVFFDARMPHAQRVRFRDLEPYMHDQPWSRALKGKRVLVIHPFAETIAQQYGQRRAQLFQVADTLPPFELFTIKAVQSIANNPTAFTTWFDALKHMKAQMDAVPFDVAIIGCGAYGLPLAAHAKRLGRVGIHLGGQTQLLFGIKGKRWETGHERIQRLFNEHWVYPDESDRPKNFGVVEGGAYW